MAIKGSIDIATTQRNVTQGLLMCTPFFKYYSEWTLRKLRMERENRLKDVKYAFLLEVESTEFI